MERLASSRLKTLYSWSHANIPLDICLFDYSRNLKMRLDESERSGGALQTQHAIIIMMKTNITSKIHNGNVHRQKCM